MHCAAPPNQRSVKALTSLKLTPREAEVLFWISQGKSNYDIGVIVGAKTGTVCKHVEHILGKLNVENRTAAAVIALEVFHLAAPTAETGRGPSWAAISGFITTQLCAFCSQTADVYGALARMVA